MEHYLEYIHQWKQKCNNIQTFLKSINGENVCLILGNESADLDSVVCSLVYGYYLFMKNKEQKDTLPKVYYFPILQCKEEDIYLKTEVIYVLNQLCINPKSLFYTSSIDLNVITNLAIDKKCNLSVCLVDHNKLSENTTCLKDYVTTIIDHHKDEQVIENNTNKLIEMVGSCSTLIGEQILAMEANIDHMLSYLLVSAIIIDTGNLEKGNDRTTDKDIKIVENLSKHVTNYNQNELYTTISHAKQNVDSLSAIQLLERDSKLLNFFTIILGCSTITGQSIIDYFSREDAILGALDFLESKKLQAVLLLTFHQTEENTVERELCLVAKVTDNISNMLAWPLLMEMFTGHDELGLEELDLEAHLLPGFERVIIQCFIQNNTAMTRKHILPLLTRCIHTIEQLQKENPVPQHKPLKLSDSQYDFNKLDANYLPLPLAERTQSLSTLEIDYIQAHHSLDTTNEGVFFSRQEDRKSFSKSLSNQNSSNYDEITDTDDIFTTNIFDKCFVKSKAINIDSSINVDNPNDTDWKRLRKKFRKVKVGEKEYVLDMELIGKFSKVYQHGGYTRNKIRIPVAMLFGKHMPLKIEENYEELLQELFIYVLSLVDELIFDSYILVYFHTGVSQQHLPPYAWIKHFYEIIDKKLKKNVIGLYLVHPSSWVKNMLNLSKPFISKKFWQKLHFVETAEGLETMLNMEPYTIPKEIMDYDIKVPKVKKLKLRRKKNKQTKHSKV